MSDNVGQRNCQIRLVTAYGPADATSGRRFRVTEAARSQPASMTSRRVRVTAAATCLCGHGNGTRSNSASRGAFSKKPRYTAQGCLMIRRSTWRPDLTARVRPGRPGPGGCGGGGGPAWPPPPDSVVNLGLFGFIFGRAVQRLSLSG
jgi:hypothetical protein